MPLSIDQSQQIIANEFRRISLEKQPVELYEPIRYILNLGGKRLRPSLLLTAASLFADDTRNAIAPAIAIEMFHNFTLMHDDIMDNAEVRRNQPTVHTRWDANTAILSGDAMLIKAYQYACQVPPHLLAPLLEVFNTTALEVCEGQQYDMNFETRNAVTEAEYLRMIELKTAVLIAASLKIGAIVGGASPDKATALYRFGLNIGMAFQLQDDLLDVYATNEKFGKMNGGDIVSNKKTYLLIKALELADGADGESLKMWLDKKDFDKKEKIGAVTAIFDRTQIKAITTDKISAYFDQAMIDLQSAGLPTVHLAILEQFARNLLQREY